jgi:hypothetical protein
MTDAAPDFARGRDRTQAADQAMLMAGGHQKIGTVFAIAPKLGLPFDFF